MEIPMNRRVWALFGATIAATFSLAGATSALAPDDVCADGGFSFNKPSSPFTVPSPPAGRSWTLLVLEAKHSDIGLIFVDSPVVGGSYADPTSDELQHAILCQSAAPEPTTVVEPTTTLPPTTIV